MPTSSRGTADPYRNLFCTVGMTALGVRIGEQQTVRTTDIVKFGDSCTQVDVGIDPYDFYGD